jgi:hypothetical protein
LAKDGRPQHLVEQEEDITAASFEEPAADVTGAGQNEQIPDPEASSPEDDGQQIPQGDQTTIPQDDSFVPKIVEYMGMLTKAKVNKEELVNFLKGIGKQAASASERAFIDSNLSSLSLLEETVVEEIRKRIKKEKEPEAIVTALEEVLDSYGEMGEALQRLSAAGPDKSNLWRQLVAALCNGAVVPGVIGGEVHCPRGKNEEPIVLRPICTLNWGYVDLGAVRITSTSPEDYLNDENRRLLASGAPEERRVLRNRVFVESVSDQLGGGHYVVLAIQQEDPNWELVGFTADIFRESYEAGSLTVLESMPGLSGSLAVDRDGQWVTMTTWRMATINQNEVGVDLETGVQKPKIEIIAELQGDRFVWVGDGDAFNDIGANVGKRTFKQNNSEKAEQIRQSIPDARERLMGRR